MASIKPRIRKRVWSPDGHAVWSRLDSRNHLGSQRRFSDRENWEISLAKLGLPLDGVSFSWTPRHGRGTKPKFWGWFLVRLLTSMVEGCWISIWEFQSLHKDSHWVPLWDLHFKESKEDCQSEAWFPDHIQTNRKQGSFKCHESPTYSMSSDRKSVV